MQFDVPTAQAATWSAGNADFTSGISSQVASALAIDASQINVVSVSKVSQCAACCAEINQR